MNGPTKSIMICEIYITSILLCAGVLAFHSNLPFYWCPYRQSWIKSSDPSVVCIRAPRHEEHDSNALSPCHCCRTPEVKSTTFLGHEIRNTSQYCESSPVANFDGTGETAGHCHDYQWWTHRSLNCCDCCQSKNLFVFDTDGTADDAMALSMMLNWTSTNPGNVLAGITCVRGFIDVFRAVKNVVKTLKTNKMSHVPVYRGADTRLVTVEEEQNGFGESVYGKDAFGDFFYFPDIEDEKYVTCDEHPAVFISTLVRDNPGKVTIMCTGPLTNIAIAAHILPNFFGLVKEILFLGGPNHYDPSGEKILEQQANDKLDSQASAAVFNWVAPADAPKIRIFPQPVIMEKKWRTDILTAKGTTIVKFLDHAERMILEDWKCAAPMLACAVMVPSAILGTQRGFCHFTTKETPWKMIFDPQSSKQQNVVLVSEWDVKKIQDTLLSYL